MTTAQDGGKVVNLTHQPPLPPGMLLVLISVRGWVDFRAIVRSEVFYVNEKSTDTRWDRTSNLQSKHVAFENKNKSILCWRNNTYPCARPIKIHTNTTYSDSCEPYPHPELLTAMDCRGIGQALCKWSPYSATKHSDVSVSFFKSRTPRNTDSAVCEPVACPVCNITSHLHMHYHHPPSST